MEKTIKGRRQQPPVAREAKNFNPLLPYGVPTAAEVDEFLEVMAFVVTHAMTNPSVLRIAMLAQQFGSLGGEGRP